MYSLTKLLTEEPKKLEQIGILFLKLLVTLFICSTFLGYDISVSSFIENPLSKNYSISKLILFFIAIVFVWIIVWYVIAETIMAQILIWCFSRRELKKDTFYSFLEFFKVIRKDKDNIAPGKNTISFNEWLKSYNEDTEKRIIEGKTQIRQYYKVSLVVYVVLLCSKDVFIPNWIVVIVGAMILYIFFTCILFIRFHNYFTDNFHDISIKFNHFAYSQMIVKAIENNSVMKHHYELGGRWRKIRLKRKNDIETIPESMTFHPLFYWNEEIVKAILSKDFSKRGDKKIGAGKVGNHYNVVICNYPPNEEHKKYILSQADFVYLYCEDEEQIHKNLEVFLFQIMDDIYWFD